MAPAEVTHDLDGTVPLDALLRHHGQGRLPLMTALYLGAGLARAVAQAHDEGRVLGALDASRLRCDAAGALHLAPEGGSLLAPELKRGEPPDVLSDLYAVGAILYRLLTGLTPVQALTRQPVSRLHQLPAPSDLNPGLDTSLDELVLAALSHDPGLRPISARMLLHAIERLFGELELVASPSGVARAVKATGSHVGVSSLAPHRLLVPLEVTLEKAQLAADRHTLDVAPPTETDGPSVIVTPSLMAPALHDLPEQTNVDPLPPAGTTPVPTSSQAKEAPTMPTERTSLIYGHPFFARAETSEELEQVADLSHEAELLDEDGEPPVRGPLQAAVDRALLAAWDWWTGLSLSGRRWTLAGATALVAGLFLGGILLASGSRAAPAPVAVAAKASPPVAPAPVVPAPPPAAAAPAPVAVAAPPTSRPATPLAVKQPTKKKLSKKELSKRKKAAKAKHASARRRAR